MSVWGDRNVPYPAGPLIDSAKYERLRASHDRLLAAAQLVIAHLPIPHSYTAGATELIAAILAAEEPKK